MEIQKVMMCTVKTADLIYTAYHSMSKHHDTLSYVFSGISNIA